MKKFRYLLISPSLLNILDDYELESVVAHEIGHVKNRHMIFFIFFYSWLWDIFFRFFQYHFLRNSFTWYFLQFIYKQWRVIKNRILFFSDQYINNFFIIIFQVFVWCFFTEFWKAVWFTRNKNTWDGSGIITSLDKIASAGSHSRNAPNWHHYSIQERIKFLKECEFYPELIKAHDNKVKRFVALYFIVMISLGGFFYVMNNSVLYKSELNLVEKILEKKLEIEPDNPSYHYILANLYFENKKLSMAEKQYLITLSLKPYSPEALNNLAWLYATSEDKNIRKPEEALRFALLAAKIFFRTSYTWHSCRKLFY